MDFCQQSDISAFEYADRVGMVSQVALVVKNLPTNAGVSGDVGSVSGSGRSPGIGNGYDQPRQHIIKQRHYFANNGLPHQGYCFSSGHVWMWELDYKQSWAAKNLCFWTVVLEKTVKSPLDCKKIKPVHTKGDPSWVFIGRTDAEAETPILWPPDAKSWLIGKDPDAGKDWEQEEKGMTEDEMAAWHHWLNGHEFEQSQRDSEGQRSLVYCSPWGCRVRHDLVTEQQLH